MEIHSNNMVQKQNSFTFVILLVLFFLTNFMTFSYLLFVKLFMILFIIRYTYLIINNYYYGINKLTINENSVSIDFTRGIHDEFLLDELFFSKNDGCLLILNSDKHDIAKLNIKDFSNEEWEQICSIFKC